MWQTFHDQLRTQAALGASQRALPLSLSILRSRVCGDEQPERTSSEAHRNQNIRVSHLQESVQLQHPAERSHEAIPLRQWHDMIWTANLFLYKNLEKNLYKCKKNVMARYNYLIVAETSVVLQKAALCELPNKGQRLLNCEVILGWTGTVRFVSYNTTSFISSIEHNNLVHQQFEDHYYLVHVPGNVISYFR